MKFPLSVDDNVTKKNYVAIVSTIEGCSDTRNNDVFNSMYMLGADTKELLLQKVESLTWDVFDSGYVWDNRHWGDNADYVIQTVGDSNYLELVPYDNDYQGDMCGMVESAMKLRNNGHLPSLVAEI